MKKTTVACDQHLINSDINNNRRNFVRYTGFSLAALLTAATVGFYGLNNAAAADKSGNSTNTTGKVNSMDMETALKDVILGEENAPVTIVEYLSLTCPHCATFDQEVLPVLKKQYIDSGKVRFIAREFPIDPLATAAALVARCNQDDSKKFYAIIDIILKNQRKWAMSANSDNPGDALFKLLKQSGYTRKQFDECLKDNDMLKAIYKARDIASDEFDVNATPTFFINGKKMEEEGTIENFSKAIDALLK